MLSKSPYKGTRDLFPAEKRTQNYLFEKMKMAAELFGFEPYDGPLLEEVELYKAKSGEELINDQIYSFQDRGERHVAIRPEMTPTLARMVAQIYREAPRPIKWYSIPNLMRYERPQRGRLREHWQFNVDLFGELNSYSELEILQVAIFFLESFNATSKHFNIFINHRKLVDHFLCTYLKLDSSVIYKVTKLFDRAKKEKPEVFDKNLESLITSKEAIAEIKEYLSLANFKELELFIKKINFSLESWNLPQFLEQLKEANLQDYIKFDPTIVRGLDYYTGLVFEIFDLHPDNRRAISGGGAYENLLQIFNEGPLPGIGFGLGDVTLKDFLTSHNLLPNFNIPETDIYMAFLCEKAASITFKISNLLRKENFKVFSPLETLKMKKLFSQAEKKGAKFLAFIGDDEMANNKIIIKNLQSRTQEEFDLQDIKAMTHYLSM